MNKLNERQLLDLKKKLERNKSKVSELEGQRKGLMKQLQDQYACKNVDQAETKLEKLQSKMKLIKSNIDNKVEKLQEDYPALA